MRALKSLGMFFVGLIASWVAAVAIGIGYSEIFPVNQREGAFAMGLMFIIGPFCGVIGGIAAAVWMWLRSGRAKTG